MQDRLGEESSGQAPLLGEVGLPSPARAAFRGSLRAACRSSICFLTPREPAPDRQCGPSADEVGTESPQSSFTVLSNSSHSSLCLNGLHLRPSLRPVSWPWGLGMGKGKPLVCSPPAGAPFPPSRKHGDADPQAGVHLTRSESRGRGEAPGAGAWKRPDDFYAHGTLRKLIGSISKTPVCDWLAVLE